MRSGHQNSLLHVQTDDDADDDDASDDDDDYQDCSALYPRCLYWTL